MVILQCFPSPSEAKATEGFLLNHSSEQILPGASEDKSVLDLRSFSVGGFTLYSFSVEGFTLCSFSEGGIRPRSLNFGGLFILHKFGLNKITFSNDYIISKGKAV